MQIVKHAVIAITVLALAPTAAAAFPVMGEQGAPMSAGVPVVKVSQNNEGPGSNDGRSARGGDEENTRNQLRRERVRERRDERQETGNNNNGNNNN